MKRAVCALAWLLLILYAATADAKPKTPFDAKYKGWWAIPCDSVAKMFYLGKAGKIYDSVYVSGTGRWYVGVMFVARRDTANGGKHGDRSKK